jgi:hypothetical protein
MILVFSWAKGCQSETDIFKLISQCIFAMKIQLIKLQSKYMYMFIISIACHRKHTLNEKTIIIHVNIRDIFQQLQEPTRWVRCWTKLRLHATLRVQNRRILPCPDMYLLVSLLLPYRFGRVKAQNSSYCKSYLRIANMMQPSQWFHRHFWCGCSSRILSFNMNNNLTMQCSMCLLNQHDVNQKRTFSNKYFSVYLLE